MGIDGRTSAAGGELEVEPFGRGKCGDLSLHDLDLLGREAANLGQVVVGAAIEVLRGVRCQLEAAPRHGHVLAVREPGQGPLEAALADVAPGAHDIGPDHDLHERSSG